MMKQKLVITLILELDKMDTDKPILIRGRIQSIKKWTKEE